MSEKTIPEMISELPSFKNKHYGLSVAGGEKNGRVESTHQSSPDQHTILKDPKTGKEWGVMLK